MKSAATDRSRSADSWRSRCTIPEHGYYRRARDPFGKEGDFYTAEQIQPVFGILMAARIRQLYEAMGGRADFTRRRTGRGPARDGGRVLRMELRSDRYRFGRFARAFHRRRLFQRVLRRAPGGGGGVSAKAHSANNWWISTDDRFAWVSGGRRARARSRRLPAPLLPGTGRGPLVRSQSRSAGLDGADRAIAGQRIRC